MQKRVCTMSGGRAHALLLCVALAALQAQGVQGEVNFGFISSVGIQVPVSFSASQWSSVLDPVAPTYASNSSNSSRRQYTPDTTIDYGSTSSYFGSSLSVSRDKKVIAVSAQSTGRAILLYRLDQGTGTYNLAASIGVNANGLHSPKLSSDGNTMLAAEWWFMVFRYDTSASTWYRISPYYAAEMNTITYNNIDISGDGNTYVVGNPNALFGQGAVYVYQWQGTGAGCCQGTTVPKGTAGITTIGLTDNYNNPKPVSALIGANPSDMFGAGTQVNTAGDVLVAGSWGHDHTVDGGLVDSGALRVYAYEASSDTWVQKGNTIEYDAQMSMFGISADISDDGNVVVVGSTSAGAGYGGEARVYQYSSASDRWVQLGVTLTGRGQAGDNFGLAVRISPLGNLVAVSAPGESFWFESPAISYTDSGSVRLWSWSGSNWKRVGRELTYPANSASMGVGLDLVVDSSTQVTLFVAGYLHSVAAGRLAIKAKTLSQAPDAVPAAAVDLDLLHRNLARSCINGMSSCPVSALETYEPYVATFGNDDDPSTLYHGGTQFQHWMVNLQQPYQIRFVEIYNRACSACDVRLNGAEIWVGSSGSGPTDSGNSKCATVSSGYLEDTDWVWDSPELQLGTCKGQYVYVYLPAQQYLNFYEVKVYGSPPWGAATRLPALSTIPFGSSSYSTSCAAGGQGRSSATANVHCWQNIADGKLGNENSWIAATSDPAPYVGVVLPSTSQVVGIRVSRDAMFVYSDRIGGSNLVYVASDGASYDTAAYTSVGSFTRADAGFWYFEISPPQQADKVKLRTTENGAAIDEMAVYVVDGSGSSTRSFRKRIEFFVFFVPFCDVCACADTAGCFAAPPPRLRPLLWLNIPGHRTPRSLVRLRVAISGRPWPPLPTGWCWLSEATWWVRGGSSCTSTTIPHTPTSSGARRSWARATARGSDPTWISRGMGRS